MCGGSLDFETEKIDVAAPEGISLLTDRVGEDIDRLYNAQVGETIRFSYSGGSEDGQRTVLVTSVHDDGVTGMTLERGGDYRTYKDENVGWTVYVVQPFVNPPVVDEFADSPAVEVVDEQPSDEVRVRFDEAGEKLLASLSGEQLAELYNKHVAVQGIGTTFDSNTGEVVVKLPKKESKITDVSAGSQTSSFSIVGKNGGELTVFIHDDNTVGYILTDKEGYMQANKVFEGDVRNPLETLIAALQSIAE